ncbi:ankyrin repeat protein [Xylaria nigripes]|nr:ankyrin repeat protein [Xylaria nigripes]
MKSSQLPALPVDHNELVKYIAQRPNTSLAELLEPYREFEAKLREMYAQDRDNKVLDDPYLNVLPLFTQDTPAIQTRARNLESETQDEKDKYIMPLPDDKRRPNGSPAVVGSLKEFQYNFGIFSESSLSDMDWNNIVVAGSSVVNTLLPVPPEYKKSKGALRRYYHEIFCPASDVDLFLYGLNEEQAIQKIKDIETHIRDAILSEVTVVRTKNAITICSQYPTRHVQIVLRLYKSVSEILAGFDIDCSCAAYDGRQVYVAPRALASYISQINPIDLSRRSPSYENRLSKYSHRNFEVYWPELDRSRVDPTIFERSFHRTLGLARLLVLERLPTTNAREEYLKKRREERGRPESEYRLNRRLRGNVKDIHEDEVADWAHVDEVSNYNTFALPYGEKIYARKIEKYCYAKDLLLNAEWNQPKERAVYLHRHPAFFGRAEDVLGDCCGACPKPQTTEEIEIAKKESEIYVTGNVTFRTDDPGRQEIGSFNPLCEDDWTEMAYIGDTARLCQAIVDGDLELVEDWLSQQGANPNKRDYTGRTPLHLAVISSTPDIVKCLVDHGARLIARIADGRTALHLAAARGNFEIVKILLERSNANEEKEADRQDRRQRAHEEAAKDRKQYAKRNSDVTGDISDEYDTELIDDSSDDGVKSMATGSFIKVESKDGTKDDNATAFDEDHNDPDFYKIDAVAWDSKCSALHLAILGGHCEVVKLLCQEFGADPLLPVKIGGHGPNYANSAILTLVLALALPVEKAVRMSETLLSLGATSSQADAQGATAFHHYIQSGSIEVIETLLKDDKLGTRRALNHVTVNTTPWPGRTISPLLTALDHGDLFVALELLEAGANLEIDFDSWLQGAKLSSQLSNDFNQNQIRFQDTTEQPLLLSIQSPRPVTAVALLEGGANPNSLTSSSYRDLRNKNSDFVRRLLSELRNYDWKAARGRSASSNFHVGLNLAASSSFSEPKEPRGTMEFLSQFPKGTYRHWLVSADIERRMNQYQRNLENFNREMERLASHTGLKEKMEAIRDLISQLGLVEDALLKKGAKTYLELHPEVKAVPLAQGDSNGDPCEAADSYSFDLRFPYTEGLTLDRESKYLELFEAAWAGDVEKIKSTTLAPWGPDAQQPPLKIAVADSQGNNPFSLAFLRGHLDAAKVILEITQAQWSPAEEEEEARFHMTRPRTDESDSVTESDAGGNDDNLGIYKEIVNEKYTIEDIGQVSMQVKSDVLPSTLLNWTAPTFVSHGDKAEKTELNRQDLLIFTMTQNDSWRFYFLLDLLNRFGSNMAVSDGKQTNFFQLYKRPSFTSAIEMGRTNMLAELIRQFGAGIPLEHLVQRSGMEVKVKPRYYQGLTVYGKKRADWAQKAGQTITVESSDSKTPPLLESASKGSLESVQWFLNEAPMRYYREFGESQMAREDPRLKHLNESPGGFDGAIKRWLCTQNDLVIHCAVLGPLRDETNELIKYLIQACPSALEAKSDLGYTPLYMACLMGRVQFAKTLVDAGANQSVKDKESNNIIHACLTYQPKIDQLRQMLGLFDPSLRTHMFRQRNSLAHGGDTPLHRWLKNANVPKFTLVFSNSQYHQVLEPEEPDKAEILRLLLEFIGGEELDILNGSGDTVLHIAALRSLPMQSKILIEEYPKLLHRENTVGRTPAEIAYDLFINDRVGAQKPIYIESQGFPKTLMESDPESWVSGARSPKFPKSRQDATWDMVQEYLAKTERKRRLVSLNEVNDVTRRVGESKLWRRPNKKRNTDDEDEDEEVVRRQTSIDIVTTLCRSTVAWPSQV